MEQQEEEAYIWERQFAGVNAYCVITPRVIEEDQEAIPAYNGKQLYTELKDNPIRFYEL